MIEFLLCGMALQDVESLLKRLEEKAAAARPAVLLCRMAGDALGSGELIERTGAWSRVEVSTSATFWEEGWTATIGPERKAITTASVLTLYTRDGFRQLVRSLQGFGPKVEAARLETTPRGGAWKDHPALDPWRARREPASADAVDPLLLYSLLPELLRTEADLQLVAPEGVDCTLETKRPGPWGEITKRFTIRKVDLALAALAIEERRSSYTARYEFSAEAFGSLGKGSFPKEVRATHHDFPKVLRWSYRVDPKAPEPRERSVRDFPEAYAVAPVPLDKKEIELRRVLRPDDPGPLVDLAWGEFPWKKWWHYRSSEERQNNRWMLRELRRLDPRSAMAREEWLRRTWKPGDPDEAAMLEDAPAPLYNQAAFLFARGDKAGAEAVARKGLAAASTPGERLHWTCLLVALLGGSAESTSLWMDLVDALGQELLLAEVAIGRGLNFDPATLQKRGGPVAAAALLVCGEGEVYAGAVRTLAALPAWRPLLAELLFRRPLLDAATAAALAAVEDVDTLLCVALVEKADERVSAALALWEKESTFRLWTWDAWGRTTLRMLRHLGVLKRDVDATQLAARFVEKCAAGKVPMWLGYYRWGEAVGACLLPLRAQGNEARFVELLSLSPDLADRMAFRGDKSFEIPVRGILEHLGRTRSREEAVGWVRMASRGDLKAAALRPLLDLAAELAPDDLHVANARLEAGVPMTIEQMEDVLRRSIAGAKAGTYRDRTGGNYGMIYEKLADVQVKAGKLEEAAATAREVLREYPDIDSMSIVNLGYGLGRAGRKDLERELYLLAARHNAHLRPFAAQTLIERLEPLGEQREILALSIRTLATWKDGVGRNDDFERRNLEEIRKAQARIAGKVAWPEIFQPYLEQPRAPLSAERSKLTEGALRDLDADDPEARMRAERILVLLGEAALPLLRRPALDGGPEEKGRARAVVERIYVEGWK